MRSKRQETLGSFSWAFKQKKKSQKLSSSNKKIRGKYTLAPQTTTIFSFTPPKFEKWYRGLLYYHYVSNQMEVMCATHDLFCFSLPKLRLLSNKNIMWTVDFRSEQRDKTSWMELCFGLWNFRCSKQCWFVVRHAPQPGSSPCQPGRSPPAPP